MALPENFHKTDTLSIQKGNIVVKSWKSSNLFTYINYLKIPLGMKDEKIITSIGHPGGDKIK